MFRCCAWHAACPVSQDLTAMRTGIRFTAGMVAGALLLGSVTIARPQGAPAAAPPACPPSDEPLQLCLGRSPARLGRVVDPAEYAFPFHDPYLATVTAAVLNPGVRIRREIVHVPVLPGRDDLPLLEGRGGASVALYRQDGPAPLVFILAGIGSNPYFGLGPYYAARLHGEGAHVVILPSPMSWNFALTSSASGVPGHAPDDARDLYRLMQATLQRLRERYGVQATRVDFLGASLGALEGAYLSVLDEDEGKIGIERYLLLNPPIDLSYALARLAEWEARAASIGPARAAQVGGRAVDLVETYVRDNRADPATFARAGRDFSRFSTEEIQYLIARYIRFTLPELVYVTQAIHDQRLLAAPRDEARRRLQEARAFTLKDYEEKIAVPRLAEPGVDAAGLEASGSLGPIIDRLRANPRVHIMHNADDVLASPAAIEELKAAMGSRMTVYPYGGHLGNLWYGPTQEDILAFLGAPAERSVAGPAPGAATRLSRTAPADR